ncbi:MAG: hypothetical protein K0Q87_4472 [Neobacillus sp.]|jgi:hypothetical protein|nr:hypothetical protein [Neobacillus sp.]
MKSSRKEKTMASLNMQGPFAFDKSTIDNQITKTSAGNYALGYVNKEDKLVVLYVGRSDNDVDGRIKSHIGESYTKFKYSYASSPKAAFEKECHNYHDFGGPDGSLNNTIHPDRPKNSGWKCPVCNIFG